MAKLDKFWIVTDATPESEIADVCFETTLAGLFDQVRGGLGIERHRPAIFTERDEAEAEARRRLEAARRSVDR